MTAVTKLTDRATSHSDTHKDLLVLIPASYSLGLLYKPHTHCLEVLGKAPPLCFEPIIKASDTM
jgi:hypothetical protein